MVKPVPRNLDIDVVILCGGQGTRLRGVLKDRPKTLAQIGDTTFLDLLIDNLKAHGFRRFILSVGYLREQVIDHIRRTRKEDAAQFIFSEEDLPLGTGGAVKKAAPLLASNHFLIVNGDSICQTDFKKFLAFHTDREGIFSLVLATPPISPDYGVGAVHIGENGEVVHYNERVLPAEAHFANAGIYLMNKAVFGYMPTESSFSLEYDVIPRLVGLGCYGFVTTGELIDIGTPERYAMAKLLLKKL